MHFILDADNNAVPVDLFTWASWFEETFERKRVARTVLPDGRVVSTIFLGLNHNYSESGNPPLLFETMIFKSEDDYTDEFCDRYTTWDEAEAGHENALRIAEHKV